MPLETGDYITDLVITNPLGTDAKSQGDDHIRLIKKVVQQSFPNVDDAVTDDAATMNSYNPRLLDIETDRGGYYAKISDIKNTGIEGGSTTGGQRETRELNTIENDDKGIITALTSNQITLEAGTYRISVEAPAYQSGRNRVRVQNITDAGPLLLGLSHYAGASAAMMTPATVRGIFKLNAQKVIAIEQYFELARANTGKGIATSDTEQERYTCVELWKINTSTP